MIVHATGESLREPHRAGTYAVVLTVPDELALAILADRLEAAGIALARVHEEDPPHCGALMALGIAPGRKEALRRHLSCLPLLR
jgi:hypothetical protein